MTLYCIVTIANCSYQFKDTVIIYIYKYLFGKYSIQLRNCPVERNTRKITGRFKPLDNTINDITDAEGKRFNRLCNSHEITWASLQNA